MQIAAITQHGVAGWPTFKFGPVTAGLNAVYGPPHSGKTMLANLLAHALFGKSPKSTAVPFTEPPGELIVESDSGRHRIRRYRDEHGTSRLTVAALDGSAVDASTMRRLVGGLSPGVLAPLCAVSFRESPHIAELLSAEFARGYEIVEGGISTQGSRRTAELAARRDALAHELETRIAGERRASKDLETRCRELDRLVRDEQQQMAAIEQRLRTSETALAETDARLRYRRLELSLDRQPTVDPHEGALLPDDGDEHVARVRAMLAELAQHEASVRARLGQLQASQLGGRTALSETRAWLTVARQLAADLAGEVARLARANASQQCLCRDAHPRLRPISETIERQLDELATLVVEQQRSVAATELQTEVDHVAQSQADLRRHLDQLLERRQVPKCRRAAGRQRPANESGISSSDDAGAGPPSFSAADAEQLESRRLELEQQRFQFVNELRAHERKLRDLRAQRETVDRQRAALLSARSIEYVQRELASVQQKLEQSASVCGNAGDLEIAEDNPARASDFLAQLTDGSLVRLVLVEQGRRACVVNRAGQTLRVESLTAGERDLVYLSLCLALLSAARRQGIRLPLVLDEPFERLDTRGAAALATVLDDFSRQGHQVLVFTGQQAAVERLAAVGAAIHDLHTSRQRSAVTLPAAAAPARQQPTTTDPADAKKRTNKKRRGDRPRKERPAPQTLRDESSGADRSDAA